MRLTAAGWYRRRNGTEVYVERHETGRTEWWSADGWRYRGDGRAYKWGAFDPAAGCYPASHKLTIVARAAAPAASTQED